MLCRSFTYHVQFRKYRRTKLSPSFLITLCLCHWSCRTARHHGRGSMCDEQWTTAVPTKRTDKSIIIRYLKWEKINWGHYFSDDPSNCLTVLCEMLGSRIRNLWKLLSSMRTNTLVAKNQRLEKKVFFWNVGVSFYANLFITYSCTYFG